MSDSGNLINTAGGRKVYQKVVSVGDNKVTVKVVTNAKGNLNSVFVVKK